MLNPLSTLTLAQAASDKTQLLTDALALMVVGMLVVFTALTLTALAILLLNHWDRKTAPPQTAPTPPPTAQTDKHLIVVLAAAAATALIGKNVRIRDIQPAVPAT